MTQQELKALNIGSRVKYCDGVGATITGILSHVGPHSVFLVEVDGEGPAQVHSEDMRTLDKLHDESCDCGPCEQVREDEERAQERDAAEERAAWAADEAYARWKDEGRHER